MKQCTKCKLEKSLEEFFKVSRVFNNPSVNKDRRNTVCKKCTSEQIALNRKNNPEKYAKLNRDWNRKNPEKRKLILQRYYKNPQGIYRHLIKRGRENVVVSKEDFIDWYNKQQKICFYCKIPEDKVYLISNNKMTRCKRLTIDRLNPKDKYRIDNICLACVICNMVKSDVFTPTEMSEVGKIINKKWKNLC